MCSETKQLAASRNGHVTPDGPAPLSVAIGVSESCAAFRHENSGGATDYNPPLPPLSDLRLNPARSSARRSRSAGQNMPFQLEARDADRPDYDAFKVSNGFKLPYAHTTYRAAHCNHISLVTSDHKHTATELD